MLAREEQDEVEMKVQTLPGIAPVDVPFQRRSVVCNHHHHQTLRCWWSAAAGWAVACMCVGCMLVVNGACASFLISRVGQGARLGSGENTTLSWRWV